MEQRKKKPNKSLCKYINIYSKIAFMLNFHFHSALNEKVIAMFLYRLFHYIVRSTELRTAWI